MYKLGELKFVLQSGDSRTAK